MTSFPGVSFPPSIIGTLAGVDHRHHGHGRGDRGTMTSLPALALPAVDRRHAARPWRQLPAVDRRHHGHGRAARRHRGDCGNRGTMTSFPVVSFPAVESRGPRHVRTAAR